jgi:hypothetical protein
MDDYIFFYGMYAIHSNIIVLLRFDKTMVLIDKAAHSEHTLLI